MNFELYLPILQQIFEVCVIPLLGVLTAYLVKLIQTKSKELAAKTDNELADKYILMASDTIVACVVATNQTYVEALKKKNAFDTAAQQQAFQMTLDAVKALLTDEAQKYLSEAYGDVTAYLRTQIEAAVNQNK